MLPTFVRVPLSAALALALAGAGLPPVQAQPAAAPAPAARPDPPDPLDPDAPVPAPALPRALSDYRPLRDDPALSWREANDTVGRIGGWRAYLREAHRPETPAAAASQARPQQARP